MATTKVEIPKLVEAAASQQPRCRVALSYNCITPNFLGGVLFVVVGLACAAGSAFAAIGDLSYSWPLPGIPKTSIAQSYAEYEGYADGKYHTGLDIGASVGTDVHAAAAGLLEFVQFNPSSPCSPCEDNGFGNTVVLRHNNGTFTQYSHLSSLAALFAFDPNWQTKCPLEKDTSFRHRCVQSLQIPKGTLIGETGRSGRGNPNYYPGAHLHFEIKRSSSLGTGYTTDHPDTLDYENPIDGLEAVTARLGYSMQVTSDGAGIGMRMGPGAYTVFAQATEGLAATSAATSPPTDAPPCSQGWVEVFRLSGGKFASTPGLGLGTFPTAWICRGDDGVTYVEEDDCPPLQCCPSARSAAACGEDAELPSISAFAVSPTSIEEGNSFEIKYTVSDGGGSGLAAIQVWRTVDDNGDPYVPGWENIASHELSGDGPESGSFFDYPSVGTFWYGIHAIDESGNIATESDAGFSPRRRIVTLGEECASNAYTDCHNGDAYWYDSCGNREEMYDDCGSAVCADGQCGEDCYSRDYTDCFNGDAYWYDSCDEREELYADCGDGECDDGYCSGGGDCIPDDGFQYCYTHTYDTATAEIQLDTQTLNTSGFAGGEWVTLAPFKVRVKCNGDLYRDPECDGETCDGDYVGNDGTFVLEEDVEYGNAVPTTYYACVRETDEAQAYAEFGFWTSDPVVRCFSDGHCQDGEICETQSSPSDWQCSSCQCSTGPCCDGCLVLTGTCSDGNACTTNDSCSGVDCVGIPSDCDDSNVCTTDSCDANLGCQHSNSSDPCDDGSPCTTGDTCSNGACVGQVPTVCNDNNPCTTDSCAQNLDCIHTYNSIACDDGNPCTTAELCVNGVCAAGQLASCDDGNHCTYDSCVNPAGCQHVLASSCDTADCVVSFEISGDAPLGALQVTIRESSLGAFAGSTPCESLIPSTLFAQNNSAADKLTLGWVATLESGFSVPTVAARCQFTASSYLPLFSDFSFTFDVITDPNGEASSAGIAINEISCDTECGNGMWEPGEHCDNSSDCCNSDCTRVYPGTACATDGNVCTFDACGIAGTCQHFNTSDPCDDGSSCTTDDECTNGTCVGVPVNCSDENACTVDTCSAASGCVYSFNTTPCNDGNPCTKNDVCTSGTCIGSLDPSCTPPTTLEPELLCGDASEDGKVTTTDALLVLRAAVGIGSCPDELCDYNGDGQVKALDALAVLRVAVSLPGSPNCPSPSGGELRSDLGPTTIPLSSTTLPDSP
jgi:hypothetical protein